MSVFLLWQLKVRLFFIWGIYFTILSRRQKNVITRSFTSLNWAIFLCIKCEELPFGFASFHSLYFSNLSFVHKSHKSTFDCLSSTNARMHKHKTHTYVVKALFITYSFFWFSLQKPIFQSLTPLSQIAVSLSDTRKKKRFFSSLTHALLFLTSHSFFSIVFSSSNFGFLSLHVGNKYWVCGGFDLTPFCLFKYFQDTFLFLSVFQ